MEVSMNTKNVIIIASFLYTMSGYAQGTLNNLFSTYSSNIKVNNPPYDNSSCLYATHYMNARQVGMQLILEFGFGWDEKDGYIQKDNLVINLSTAKFYTGFWSKMRGKWEQHGDKKIVTIEDENGMEFTQIGAQNYNQGTKQNIISLIKSDFQTIPLANRVISELLKIQEPYKTKDPWLLPESIEEASKSPLLQAPKKKNVSKATAKKRISSKENSIRKQQKTKSGKYGQ